MRDSNGKWISRFVANLGHCSAMVAEIWGAWYALQFAWKRNVKKLILELDSLLVVQLIKNGPKSINVAISIIMKIRRMLSFAWKVRIQHVMREGNRAADALTNIRVRMQLGYHELDCAPTNVFDIIMQDIVGVSFSRFCS